MTKRSQFQLILNELAQADRSQPPQCAQKHRANDAGRQSAFKPQRHAPGLTAETVIAAVEDTEDYQAFEAAVTADYDAEIGRGARTGASAGERPLAATPRNRHRDSTIRICERAEPGKPEHRRSRLTSLAGPISRIKIKWI